MASKDTRVVDAALQGIEGVKAYPSGDLLTYDNGKIIPKEWFDDSGGSGLPELSDEEAYTEILNIGLPRMPKLEATLDMDQIDHREEG